MILFFHRLFVVPEPMMDILHIINIPLITLPHWVHNAYCFDTIIYQCIYHLVNIIQYFFYRAIAVDTGKKLYLVKYRQ